MAEQEVIKHTKKMYKIWKSKENSFGHKLKEFLLEIFIIVFAVSLTIWFHDISAKLHQEEEVRDFYIDLKSDLENDKKEILKEKKVLLNSNEGKIQQRDTIKLNLQKTEITNSPTRIISINRKNNKGNFESFKSSGNTSFIHNKLLKRLIFTYYEQNLKKLETNEEQFNNQGEKVLDYILQNKKENKSFIYSNSILYKNFQNRLIEKYDEVTKEINILLNEIDKELK